MQPGVRLLQHVVEAWIARRLEHTAARIEYIGRRIGRIGRQLIEVGEHRFHLRQRPRQIPQRQQRLSLAGHGAHRIVGQALLHGQLLLFAVHRQRRAGVAQRQERGPQGVEGVDAVALRAQFLRQPVRRLRIVERFLRVALPEA